MIKHVWIVTLLLTSCYKVPDQIEPKVDYCLQDQYLLNLPSPFQPLSEEEKHEDFGKEALIAFRFAHDLDLYQAITAFKRASYLCQNQARTLEFEYEILLCYYIGRKYPEVIYQFEHSPLRFVDTQFPACKDLLIILFDSYTKVKDFVNRDRIYYYIKDLYPETAEAIELSYVLQTANLPEIEKHVEKNPYLSSFLESYSSQKKSIGTSQILNAVLPGAGYFYIGQRQTALTAALFNGLFVWASYLFFHKGNIPAGVIFATFEAGWYFGGIYGVGQETKFYNERIYEKYATPMMNQKGLFPAFMIRHAF